MTAEELIRSIHRLARPGAEVKVDATPDGYALMVESDSGNWIVVLEEESQ